MHEDHDTNKCISLICTQHTTSSNKHPKWGKKTTWDWTIFLPIINTFCIFLSFYAVPTSNAISAQTGAFFQKNLFIPCCPRECKCTHSGSSHTAKSGNYQVWEWESKTLYHFFFKKKHFKYTRSPIVRNSHIVLKIKAGN
jgi:hypothetical protein